jgi:hypothetical protein
VPYLFRFLANMVKKKLVASTDAENSAEITMWPINAKNPIDKYFVFLLLISFVNFTFSFLIIKLLSFSIFLAPFFLLFSLLLISLGAASVRVIPYRKNISTRSLALGLALVLVLTACLFPIFLRHTHLFGSVLEASFSGLGIFLLLSLLLFLAFYAYWGRIEYIAFKLFTEHNEAPSLFYFINLVGILGSILYNFFLFPHLGIFGSLIVLLSLIIVYAIRKKTPVRVGLALLFCGAGVYLVQPLEHPVLFHFLSETDAYNIKNNQMLLRVMPSSNPRSYRRELKIINQKWSPYCHYSLSAYRNYIFGSYNGYPYWFYMRGMQMNSISFENLGMALARDEANMAILGSGGGIQVKMALDFNPRMVHAVEVIPDVIKDLTGKYADLNDRLYLHPRVKAISAEGSNYIMNSNEKFDLIMSANTESVIGIVRNMFEPSQLLHTYESMKEIFSKLNTGGVFSIKKMTWFDNKEHSMFYNYFYTMQKAGFQVRGLLDARRKQFLLLGFKEAITKSNKLAELEMQMKSEGVDIISSIPPSIEGRLIDHDHLYLGGVLYYIFAPELSLKIIVALAIIAGLFMVTENRLKVSNGSLRLKFVSLLVGANFIIIQNLLVQKFRFIAYNPLDAFFYGLLSFTFFALIANYLHDRFRAPSFGLALICSFLLAFSWLNIAFLIPALLVTGIYFKILFLRYSEYTLSIFVYDLFGVLFGGALSLVFLYTFDLKFFIALALVILTSTTFLLKKELGRVKGA